MWGEKYKYVKVRGKSLLAVAADNDLKGLGGLRTIHVILPLSLNSGSFCTSVAWRWAPLQKCQRPAGGPSMEPKYNHGQVRPDHFYNGILHYKLTNNMKNWKDSMQSVKTHSTAFNQGQRFVMNGRSVSTPPPVPSVLILSVLSHTHALWLTAPLLLFLSLGGLLEPLFTWGSARHRRKQNPCSSSARRPRWVVPLAAAQLPQVSFFIFFLFLLSFFPGTPAIQTTGASAQTFPVQSCPWELLAFCPKGFLDVFHKGHLLTWVIQSHGESSEWFLVGSDSHIHLLSFHIEKLCAKITPAKYKSSFGH